MKVLHYTLGMAPYRSGGLTAWSEDLMRYQAKQGVEIVLLYPAEIRLFNKKMTIKSDGLHGGRKVFRLVNPLPIPLIYGVDSVDHYVQYDGSADFKAFFTKHQFDAIHLHTLIGLPVEFLQQAKALDISIVYTAHDTFGIWPEPSLNDEKNPVDPIFYDGYIGAQRSLSYRTIFLAQTTMYRRLKDTAIITLSKKLLKKVMTRRTGTMSSVEHSVRLPHRALYQQLRQQYNSYFALIDTIHFNSQMTKEIFEAYGVTNDSVIASVFHSHMLIAPQKQVERHSPLRILYNGTREQYKGYPLLLTVLDELYAEGLDAFTLVVYGTDHADRAYVEPHATYSIDTLHTVYEGIDVTVVPSLYFETFGMVVAESLSFGVPVIVSRTVGAKTLLRDGTYGSVFATKVALKQVLREAILDGKTIAAQRQAIGSSTELIFDYKVTFNTVTALYAEKAHV